MYCTAYPWFGNPITLSVPVEHLCQQPATAKPSADTVTVTVTVTVTDTAAHNTRSFSLLSPSKIEAFLDRCDRHAKQGCRYLYSSQAAATGSRPVVDMAKDADDARKEDRQQRDDVLRCQEMLEEADEGLPGWWPRAMELTDLNRVQVGQPCFCRVKAINSLLFLHFNCSYINFDGFLLWVFIIAMCAGGVVCSADAAGHNPGVCEDQPTHSAR